VPPSGPKFRKNINLGKESLCATSKPQYFSQTLYFGFSLVTSYFEEERRKSKDIGATATF